MVQRRRGQVLEAAIYDAALTELSTVGYGRMTMEGIAARAGTAKSSLYRRWSSLEELTVQTLHSALPNATPARHTGDMRADIIDALTQMADTLAGPIGRGIASILGDLERSPSLQATARQQIIEPRMRTFRTITDDAAARGEIRPGAATPFVLRAGPSIVFNSVMVEGLRLSAQDIEDIVDQVILPALGVRAS